ncbi:MAG: DNA primase [Parcubacteria group bacterium]|jgi:DNA primase
MNSVVPDIKSRINIVDLIGEYIRVQKAGSSWKGLCPFHHEKSPSFMINEEKQIWHCFGCGKGGDVFGFLMEIEGIEFKEALKILAEKTGIELPKFSKDQAEFVDDRKKTLEILELSTKFYEKQLWDGMGKEKILNYLRERGLNSDSMKEFRLGYAPNGWKNLLEFLTKRGYNTQDIIKTGLLVEKNKIPNSKFQIPNSSFYDRFRDRITFPVMDVMGQVVGFSARVAPGGDESQAKYVNTPETSVYHKSKVLYGLSRAKQNIKTENSVIIVEGNMDVIAAHQAGIKNTVAVSGTALTGEQVDILKRYASEVKMLFDMDSAGEKATQRSAEICFQKDINVSVITLPEGKDAAELVQKNPKKFVETMDKATPIMEYFFNNYFEKYNKNKVGDKKIIAAELLNIIKNFGNAIEKNHWIKKLAQKLDVPENILIETLKKTEDRFNGPKTADKAKEKIISKTRVEILKEKIAGIMLNDGILWKEILIDPVRREYLFRDQKLVPILEKGSEARYKFENLISLVEDKEGKDFLQKIYFNTKYSMAEEEAEENDLSDLREQFLYCFNELKKELSKKKLGVLLCDIQKAEEIGDDEGKILLINEFNKLSKENK